MRPLPPGDLRREGRAEGGGISPEAPSPPPDHLALNFLSKLISPGSPGDPTSLSPAPSLTLKGEIKGQSILPSGVSGPEGVAASLIGLQARQVEGGGVPV